MKKYIILLIAASGVVIGVGAYIFLSRPEGTPAWIFASKVSFNEVLNREGMVHLEERDASKFKTFDQALREADPIHPVEAPGRVGRKIVDLLGGEETDIPRARVKDVVYCYSIEVNGEYYNVCIIFHEDRDDAMVTGTYWVAGYTG
jgi:hypothetical protein